MKGYTFERLPAAIGRIEEKLNLIQNILLSKCGEDSKEDLLSIKEASKFLNLTVSTVYSKVSRQEIPVFKKGKRLYFSLMELDEWVRSGKKMTVEEIQKQVSLNKKSNRMNFF